VTEAPPNITSRLQAPKPGVKSKEPWRSAIHVGYGPAKAPPHHRMAAPKRTGEFLMRRIAQYGETASPRFGNGKQGGFSWKKSDSFFRLSGYHDPAFIHPAAFSAVSQAMPAP
ncbi:MAG: hypothetical protein OXU22_06865, partial [Gammaproteobacteria bacterium]|nr:hypothetical protein [Gammaproteobacteria bacterium]